MARDKYKNYKEIVEWIDSDDETRFRSRFRGNTIILQRIPSLFDEEWLVHISYRNNRLGANICSCFSKQSAKGVLEKMLNAENAVDDIRKNPIMIDQMLERAYKRRSKKRPWDW